VMYGPYVQTPPAQGDSLTSYRRPLEGGLLVTYRYMSDTSFSGCTAGFIAALSGVRVMITASHCSQRQWWSDNTSFFQAQPGVGRYFGYEYRDPAGEVCGIADWSICRNAEALAIALESDVPAAAGRIARPEGLPRLGRSPYGNPVGSLRIDPAAPAFVVTGRAPAVVQSMDVDKVGAATGWTEGAVARTCVDLRAERPNGKIRCQHFALYSSAGGDSGAPVFTRNPDGSVLLAGLHWGATTDNVYAIFSSLASIEMDLGTLELVPSASSGGGGDPGGGTGPAEPGSGCNPECVT
jgi:hypothetical protein